MRLLKPAVAALLALGAMAGANAAVHAPRLAATSFNQLAQPLPYPYDEKADAARDVERGLSRAKAERKLLLVDMGGNWCGDCRVLAGTMALPDLAPFVTAHYVLVMVDVGRFTKNAAIAHRFGAPSPTGVPALLVVDPNKLALLDEEHTQALADARSMTPQALADWLAQWTKR